MRLILNCDAGISPTEMLIRLTWYPLSYRYKFNNVVSVYKALHGQYPTYISRLLSPYRPSRSLRSVTNHSLLVPFARTNVFEESFRVAAPTLYNQLPAAIRSITNIRSFKIACHKHYFQGFIDDNVNF